MIKRKKKEAAKNLKCPFCKSTFLKFISKGDDRKIFKCQQCGLVSAADEVIKGKISAKAVSRLETHEYHKKVKNWQKAYIGEKNLLIKRFQPRFSQISKIKNPGRILDIGCASGFLLEIAKKQGWQVFGVDTSPEMVRKSRQLLKTSHIFSGTLGEAGFKDRFFDAITVFDTLEHIPNLKKFLAESKRILKPNGVIAVCVPNKAGIVSKLMGRNWFDYQRLQHLYFFSPQTLTMILEKSGFTLVSKKHERFLQCPTDTLFNKSARYYPRLGKSILVTIFERVINKLRIESLPLPLEHIYVIAEKNKK